MHWIQLNPGHCWSGFHEGIKLNKSRNSKILIRIAFAPGYRYSHFIVLGRQNWKEEGSDGRNRNHGIGSSDTLHLRLSRRFCQRRIVSDLQGNCLLQRHKFNLVQHCQWVNFILVGSIVTDFVIVLFLHTQVSQVQQFQVSQDDCISCAGDLRVCLLIQLRAGHLDLAQRNFPTSNQRSSHGDCDSCELGDERLRLGDFYSSLK